MCIRDRLVLLVARLILAVQSSSSSIFWLQSLDRLVLKTMAIAEGARIRSPAWYTAHIRRHSRVSNAFRKRRSATTLSAPRRSGVIWTPFLSALMRRRFFRSADHRAADPTSD